MIPIDKIRFSHEHGTANIVCQSWHVFLRHVPGPVLDVGPPDARLQVQPMYVITLVHRDFALRLSLNFAGMHDEIFFCIQSQQSEARGQVGA